VGCLVPGGAGGRVPGQPGAEARAGFADAAFGFVGDEDQRLVGTPNKRRKMAIVRR